MKKKSDIFSFAVLIHWQRNISAILAIFLLNFGHDREKYGLILNYRIIVPVNKAVSCFLKYMCAMLAYDKTCSTVTIRWKMIKGSFIHLITIWKEKNPVSYLPLSMPFSETWIQGFTPTLLVTPEKDYVIYNF